jgi:hypothetical protein
MSALAAAGARLFGASLFSGSGGGGEGADGSARAAAPSRAPRPPSPPPTCAARAARERRAHRPRPPVNGTAARAAAGAGDAPLKVVLGNIASVAAAGGRRQGRGGAAAQRWKWTAYVRANTAGGETRPLGELLRGVVFVLHRTFRKQFHFVSSNDLTDLPGGQQGKGYVLDPKVGYGEFQLRVRFLFRADRVAMPATAVATHELVFEEEGGGQTAVMQETPVHISFAAGERAIPKATTAWWTGLDDQKQCMKAFRSMPVEQACSAVCTSSRR